ncbi:GNAT family N-acetyltransferase [Bhargavaea cecembensis]|uniref:GNAT family N-acetyltransferase n=1 Tax=Bhargavaea cecembensis TaxID=394098 RepID=UPI00058DD27C|nr:GNAT family N-acetyltransferase [Bhargavaea cecembensis]
MTAADIPHVRRVATESWHATYEGLIPREVQDRFLDQAYSPGMLEKRCGRTPFYVAETGNEIIGFANFSPVREDGSVELAAIYLLPEAQNRGAGSKLLRQGIRELQPKSVFIDVESGNRIGKTFYEAKGFRTVEEFDDDFDGHVLKTERMRLDLE